MHLKVAAPELSNWDILSVVPDDTLHFWDNHLLPAIHKFYTGLVGYD